ncbi:MAG: hypothetical protein ACREMY_04595, partial [bacterium]
ANISGVVAEDALGNATARTFVLRVDHTAPDIGTSGSLTQGAGSGPYTLHVDAVDGDASDSSGGQWQSGVKRINVFVNGALVMATGDHACTGDAGSCPLSTDYTLNPSDFPTNDLHIKVAATDELDHTSTTEWDTTISGASSQPRLDLSGGLFNAPSGWVDQLHTYQLLVAAQDAAGATQLQLLIDGQQIDSSSQNCPLGGCTLSRTFTVDPAQYGGGAHTVKVIGTDASGQTSDSTWTMNVNPSGTIGSGEATNTLRAADDTTNSATVEPPDQALPAAEIADGYDPTLNQSGSDLTSNGTPNLSAMTTSASTGFTIQAPDDSYHVTPTAVSGTASTASVAGTFAAVTANARSEVDSVVSPIYNGDTTSVSIRSANAAEAFSWQVHLGTGQTLQSTSNQSAEVYNNDGSPAMMISTDTAVDATGAPTPTTVTVSGTTVTLTIAHHGTASVYPIVGYLDWQTGWTPPAFDGDPGNSEVSGDPVPLSTPAPEVDTTEPAELLPNGHRREWHRQPFSHSVCAQGPIFGCGNFDTTLKGYYHFNGRYGHTGGYAYKTGIDQN